MSDQHLRDLESKLGYLERERDENTKYIFWYHLRPKFQLTPENHVEFERRRRRMQGPLRLSLNREIATKIKEIREYKARLMSDQNLRDLESKLGYLERERDENTKYIFWYHLRHNHVEVDRRRRMQGPLNREIATKIKEIREYKARLMLTLAVKMGAHDRQSLFNRLPKEVVKMILGHL
eukprot:Tamp_23538.p1 GENE.Tamp_23538~~Tamp_23538.p1  ORF type:complete len:179 (-),score=8.61 Tamp_23538:259-795(-)